MKNYTTMTQRRDSDIISAARKILDRHPGLSVSQLAYKLQSVPAPRFYVSYCYASSEVGRMMAGEQPMAKSPEKRRQWQELLEMVRKSMLRRRGGMGQAVARVLNECGASSFYLRYATLLRILYSNTDRLFSLS
ncbi:MAG: hypothetical protein NC111_00990 [Bacteroides sp.]|nr:hypothetical protein [Bacteroides sp.]MCM1413540.1 hypothetical protein [Bacteroides sp.]MCM1471094.1 hypothetical protein [Bacteroides sp.]